MIQDRQSGSPPQARLRKITTPFADAVLRLGDPHALSQQIVSFHALPLSRGQGLRGDERVLERFRKLLCSDFLDHEVTYSGEVLDSYFRPTAALDHAQHLAAPAFGADRTFFVTCSYYGTTETDGNLIADPADLAVSPRTSGLPLPGNEVCVIGGDGRPAAPGQVGRIGLASYMAMAGYVDHDEERLTVDGTEYLITVDYGYLDAHAKIVLTYRDDGLAAPERVPGHDIEADLLEIDGITDAAVVRRAVLGSAPCLHAAVVVESNADRDLIHKHADYVLEYRLARTMPCRVVSRLLTPFPTAPPARSAPPTLRSSPHPPTPRRRADRTGWVNRRVDASRDRKSPTC